MIEVIRVGLAGKRNCQAGDARNVQGGSYHTKWPHHPNQKSNLSQGAAEPPHAMIMHFWRERSENKIYKIRRILVLVCSNCWYLLSYWGFIHNVTNWGKLSAVT